jgi:hypothetical protein
MHPRDLYLARELGDIAGPHRRSEGVLDHADEFRELFLLDSAHVDVHPDIIASTRSLGRPLSKT